MSSVPEMEDAIDIEQFCIVCLTPKEEDYDQILINENDETKELLDLGELYENVFNLKISDLAFCPEYMCTDCSLQLKLFNKLKKKAEESFEFIKKNNLDNSTNDIEDNAVLTTNTNDESQIEQKQDSDDKIKIEMFDSEEYELTEEFDDKYIYVSQPPEKNNGNVLIYTTNDINSEQQNEFLLDESATAEPSETLSKILPTDIKNQTMFSTINSENNLLSDYQINDDDKYVLDENDLIETVIESDSENNGHEYMNQNMDDIDFIIDHKSQLDYPFATDENNYITLGSERKYTYKQITLKLSKDATLSALYCKECDVYFSTKQLYIQHRRDHHPRVKKACNMCSKITFSDEAHQVHMRSHVGLPAYECHICDKTFKQKAHLIYHMQGHTNDLQAPCTLCPKKFRNKADLKIHMRCHLDERPYECDICNKRFRAHTHMTNHRYGHFGKTIECPQCHQKYSSPNTLRTHIKAVHEGLAPFECKVCSKKFKRKHHLLCHTKMHEREKIKRDYILRNCFVQRVEETDTMLDEDMDEERIIDEDKN